MYHYDTGTYSRLAGCPADELKEVCGFLKITVASNVRPFALF